MATQFGDRLITAIKAKGNPCVVGLDFHEQGLPAFVPRQLASDPTPEGYRRTIAGFFSRVIDAVAPLVPAVKPQIALLEKYTWVGAQIFGDIVRYSQKAGLIVIADAKRGDIASSASGYADAFLSDNPSNDFAHGYGADAVTVNAFLGRDTLEPYVARCVQSGRGIFVLVKTSNKGSKETQDQVMKDSEDAAFTTYATIVDELGRSSVGASGYSAVGAVVGATFPEQAKRLRKLMPHAIVLVPGYGAQGGTANDAAFNFNDQGLGAVVNSSRGITHTFGDLDVSEEQYSACVRQNVTRMIDEINGAIARA